MPVSVKRSEADQQRAPNPNYKRQPFLSTSSPPFHFSTPELPHRRCSLSTPLRALPLYALRLSTQRGNKPWKIKVYRGVQRGNKPWKIWRKDVQRTAGYYIWFKQKQNEIDRLKYNSKESLTNLSWVIAQVQFYGKTEKENKGCKLHLCHAPSKARHPAFSTIFLSLACTSI